MAAPVVATAAQNNGTANYTVTKPTGTADGDLLIGVVASDWGTFAGNAFPAGWTALTTSDYDGGTDAYHVALFARVASSEPANYTISVNGSADSAAGILRVTGWDSASGIAGIVQVAPSTTGNGTTAPTITPGTATDLLITAHSGEFGGNTVTWTPPSGMTEHVDAQSTTWTSLEVCSLQNPSTPSGTKTATPSASPLGAGAGCTISIKPVSGGGSNFTQTPADDLGLTDSAVVVKSLTVVVTDAMGLSDPGFATDHGEVDTDPLGLTDSVSVAKSLTQTPADDEGLTDSPAFSRSLVFSDSEGLTDTASSGAEFTVSALDNLGLTESADVGEAKAPIDVIGLTDASVLDRSQNSTESLGLTDSPQVTLSGSGAVNPADNLGLGDSATLDQAHTLTDPLGLADTVANALIRGIADAANLTDAVSVDRGMQSTDQIGLTDTAQVAVVSSGAVTATDSENLADTTVFTSGHVLTESAGVTDAVTLLLDSVKSILDNAALSDVAQVLLMLPPTSGTASGAAGPAPTAIATVMTVPTATGG